MLFLVWLFGKISLLIYFILAFLAGIIFSVIHMIILTKMAFVLIRWFSAILHSLMFGTIFIPIHFILTYLAGLIFSAIEWIILPSSSFNFNFNLVESLRWLYYHLIQPPGHPPDILRQWLLRWNRELKLRNLMNYKMN